MEKPFDAAARAEEIVLRAQDQMQDEITDAINDAVQEERERCLAWARQFDTPETRRIIQGVESGEVAP